MEKKLTFLFFLFLFSSFVFAGLDVVSPEQSFFKFGEDFDLSFSVFDNATGVVSNGGVSCDFNVYNKRDGLILTGSSVDSVSNVFDEVVSLNSSVVDTLGFYSYKVFCNTTSSNGFVTDNFFVTRNGEDDTNPIVTFNLIALILLFLGVSLVSLWISHLFDSEEFSALRLVFFWMSIINLLVCFGYYYLVTSCVGGNCYDIGRFSPHALTYFSAYGLFTVYVLWNYTIQKMRKSTHDWVVKK